MLCLSWAQLGAKLLPKGPKLRHSGPDWGFHEHHRSIWVPLGLVFLLLLLLLLLFIVIIIITTIIIIIMSSIISHVLITLKKQLSILIFVSGWFGVI